MLISCVSVYFYASICLDCFQLCLFYFYAALDLLKPACFFSLVVFTLFAIYASMMVKEMLGVSRHLLFYEAYSRKLQAAKNGIIIAGSDGTSMKICTDDAFPVEAIARLFNALRIIGETKVKEKTKETVEETDSAETSKEASTPDSECSKAETLVKDEKMEIRE
jgi:hypothetical protein